MGLLLQAKSGTDPPTHLLNNKPLWQFMSNHSTLGPAGWLVGWGLTALLTQNRSYRACSWALQRTT